MELDFLKKAKKNEIIIYAIAASCIVFVGYYFLFLSPVISRFFSVFREVARAQSKLNDARLSINRVPKIKEEIEELRYRTNLYSNKLPKEEEFPVVLESLSDMAKNADVKITKILPVKNSATFSEENIKSGTYNQKEISIDAQCGYHQLGEFITALENAERFMEVSDIKIEAGKANPKRHNVQLIVKTFVLKGDELKGDEQ